MANEINCQRFHKKKVVITGSSYGIGLAIARRIAKEGAYVYICSRSKSNIDKTTKLLKDEGLKVEGVVCHVGSKENRINLLKFVTKNYSSKIDCLISNAAVSPYAGPTLDISEEAFDKIMDVNFKASFQLVQEFKDWINENGSVLFVSSYIGYNPQPPIGMYAISKTGLFALTRTLAFDMWQHGKIRVNCIAPGIIKTNFSKILWGDNETFEDIKKHIIMERAGDIDEIAGPAAFLCSSDASFITGETIVVGGGVPSRL